MHGKDDYTIGSGVARGRVLWVLEHPLCPDYKACIMFTDSCLLSDTSHFRIDDIVPSCQCSTLVFDVRGVVNQLNQLTMLS